MAEYRLSAKVISRAKGRSATGAAAYRSAERIVDQRTGEIHDFTRKRGVEHSEIITPEHAPDWVTDRAELWNRVETGEARRDAQLAREFELMLPRELNREQQIELVRDFARDQLVSRGMVADIAIHNPRRPPGRENPHAHVMTSLRDIGRDGFGQKNRDWNAKPLLKEWRASWSDHCNRALERAGRPERVDHRSYADRAIDREAQPKMGRAAAMEARGIQTDRGEMLRDVAARNSERFDLDRALTAVREHLSEIKERVTQVLGIARNPMGALAGMVGNLLGRDDGGSAEPTRRASSAEVKADFIGKATRFQSPDHATQPDRDALLGRGENSGAAPLASEKNRETVDDRPRGGGHGRDR